MHAKVRPFALVARGVAVQPKSGRVDSGWGKPSFDLEREETPEPVLANMRGYSLKSLLDELPPLASDTSAPAGINLPISAILGFQPSMKFEW